MNDSDISLADARALVASTLWPRIRAFLWDFASQIDEGRFEEAGVAQSQQGEKASLTLRERNSPRVRSWVLRNLGVAPVFHAFPATDGSRLLLLSGEDYGRLAMFLGVVAFARSLRLVTLGAEVRALKSAIPDYRETLSFSAYFHRFAALFERFAPEGAPANPAAVAAAGHGVLAAALSSLPAPLLLRQRLRFPAGSPADVALGRASAPSDHQAEAAQAALLALKLSNPQEYSLCFS